MILSEYTNMRLEDLLPKESRVQSAMARAVKIIRDAHLDVADAFECVTSIKGRQAVKRYIAQDPLLRKVEAAIDGQLKVISGGDAEAAAMALERVREGIDYWQRLILKRIYRAL